MSRARRGIVVACWAVVLTGCAGVQRMSLEGIEVVTLDELRTNAGPIESAVKSGRPVVVRVRAGERVPLDAAITTPMLTLEAGENALRFERDGYLHIARGAMLVSPDGERWTAVGNGRGLRRLFGVRHGTVSIGFGVTAGRGPVVTAALESWGDQPPPAAPPRAAPAEAAPAAPAAPEATPSATEPAPAAPDEAPST